MKNKETTMNEFLIAYKKKYNIDTKLKQVTTGVHLISNTGMSPLIHPDFEWDTKANQFIRK